MAGLYDVVNHIRRFATVDNINPYFKSVSGAQTFEVAASQINPTMPFCAVVPKYIAKPSNNLNSVYREVVEEYTCLVAVNDTQDRAGSASTSELFDNAFNALRSVLDGWTPENPDGTSDYLYAFAIKSAESALITGARSFFAVTYEATRVYGANGSFLNNALYQNSTVQIANAIANGSNIVTTVVGSPLEITANVVLFDVNGNAYANAIANLTTFTTFG